MPLVAGVDSSTQASKVVLCDADDGTIIDQGSAAHPAGSQCDPQAWWQALHIAGQGLLERADAISVAAQQHGMVAVDGDGEVVRPAILWNDLRSADQARDLVNELGEQQWVERAGSIPTASFTVTKLRWLAEAQPENASRAAAVMLPHDWLTWRLRGGGTALGPTIDMVTTDRADASGTGYFSPISNEYQYDLVERALGRQLLLPAVASGGTQVGSTSQGAVVAAGTGDNAGAALGLGIQHGDVVVSLGTSGTAFALSDVPAADVSGEIAGFAAATDSYLPLVCTLNAAQVIDSAASAINATKAQFDLLALQAPSGSAGLTLLPYLGGERTPNRPSASGVLAGITTANLDRGHLARAAVEGVLCGLADAIDRLLSHGVTLDRVLLVGGAAGSEAVRRIAATVFASDLTVPQPAEYVAIGAAKQAAWALSGAAQPPRWPSMPAHSYEANPMPHVRHQFAKLREETRTWKEHQ